MVVISKKWIILVIIVAVIFVDGAIVYAEDNPINEISNDVGMFENTANATNIDIDEAVEPFWA